MSERPVAGALLGTYRLIEPIGHGGFSEVWRAREDGDDEDLAVKIVTDLHHADLVRREAHALRNLAGPGIVLVHDADWQHEPPYVVLELVRGGDLRSKLRASGGRMKWSSALALVDRLLETLERVHATGMVHGDLKPENVLFRSDSGLDARPLLADFALSKDLARASASLSVSRSVADTRLAGTLAYLAPEVRRGGEATLAADVFALGMILYELIAGARPEGAFEPPTSFDNEMPGFVDTVVATALAPDPDDRFPDAASFRTALVSGREQTLEAIARGLRVPVRCYVVAAVGAAGAIVAVECQNLVPRGGHPDLAGLPLGLVLAAVFVAVLHAIVRGRWRRLEACRSELRALARSER